MLDSLRERRGGKGGRGREYKFIIIILLLLVTVHLQSVVVYENCSITEDWLDAHLVHDSITN